MRSICTHARRVADGVTVGTALVCMALLAPAYAATQLPPEVSDNSPLVVTELPVRHPQKHRTVKPGPAQPKAYLSQPQPIVNTLRSDRSPS